MLASRILLQLVLEPAPYAWLRKKFAEFLNLRRDSDMVSGFASRNAEGSGPQQQKDSDEL
jgi:hypothetical protein